MSYPSPMANWDAMVRNACLLKTRDARIAAVRETYPVPDFLRGDAMSKRQLRQGELFAVDNAEVTGRAAAGREGPR